ncbi:alpha-L RNA-binding motif-containing protein [Myriangium duriaei CBS 260.36]|uniref:Small ribosomal subunit protein uS4m n=1 Tax=Myriangium duriaei CBS 260.36 TaxID=1168546 RepID=A0A9P4MIM5_9PEZI|nr:alpha-L RNA-binding motif-containing protein [Myriangium duriaei CBS 260.36]
MTRKRFHNLKRPKIRQDWSRWTLYALAKMHDPRTTFATFFQQKWQAKSLTRGFHGNQVREQKWQLMFDRRLPAVVPMDPYKLANSDGNLQSAGRGLGDERYTSGISTEAVERTPYMHMTYWPMERRLDTAVWRALFASSALQARQFVVHGAVKVNGKKMRHPGYLLNPGDMFSVDPEKVMYATGARKFDKNSPETRQGRRKYIKDADPEAQTKEVEEDTAEEQENPDEEESKALETGEEGEEAEDTTEATPEAHRKALKLLLQEAKDILADPTQKAKLSGKRKQAMRAFSRKVRTTMSRIRGGETVKTDEGEQPVADTVADLQTTLETLVGSTTTTPAAEATSERTPETAKSETTTPESTTEAAEEDDFSPSRDAELLRSALDIAETETNEDSGVKDASKPYATPWQPREYMSAFAFIPRYLEVHHRICSAVYLRHPVARPGVAEVPAPYGETTYQLAHNWYLRRR